MQLKISLVHCLPGPNYRLLGRNYGLVAANDSLAPANHKMIRCGKGEMRLARAFFGDFNPLSATGLKLIRQAAKGIYAKFPPFANLWSAIYIMCIGFRCLRRRIGGEAAHTYTKSASRCDKLAPLRLTDGLIRDLADLT